MTRLTAQVVNDEAIKRLGEIKIIEDAIDGGADWLRDDVLPEAQRLAPRDKGALASSLKVYSRAKVSGIQTASRKAPYVHGRYASPIGNPSATRNRRTRPHFPPPNQSLRAWAKRHNIPLFLVQKAIAEKGTPIVPFIAQAVNNKLDRLRARLRKVEDATERKFNR